MTIKAACERWCDLANRNSGPVDYDEVQTEVLPNVPCGPIST